MKKLSYLSIGVLISLVLYKPYLRADCLYNEADLSQWQLTDTHYIGSITGTLGACYSELNRHGYRETSGSIVPHVPYVQYTYIYRCYGYQDINENGVYDSGEPQGHIVYDRSSNVCHQPVISDSDGDGLPDECDVYPDDPTSYSVKTISYQTTDGTSSGDKTYVCYVTDRGDRFCSGTDGLSTGATEYVIADGTWMSGEDLCSDGLPGPASPAPTTTVPTPSDPDAPSSPGAEGDSDSELLKKIAGNTDSTNKNLENLAEYLGITNNLLGKINNNSDSSDGSGITVTTPTADEIGQSVKDNLIDPGQTIDITTTDNIPDLDKTETFTEIKTKYSDRYDLFITTLKDSDLFSLPFDIFAGPSGSGVSIQTIDIGRWGAAGEQTVTIDYSDYDGVWEILRSVLLLLTSFACFKILVLKKG